MAANWSSRDEELHLLLNIYYALVRVWTVSLMGGDVSGADRVCDVLAITDGHMTRLAVPKNLLARLMAHAMSDARDGINDFDAALKYAQSEAQ